MTWTAWTRTIHRWTSVVFFLAVGAATFAAVTGLPEDTMLYYLPLPPLFIQMLTGLYLFVLPYARRWRGQPTRS